MKKKRKYDKLESASLKLTEWMGSPESLIAHSIFFVGIFSLRFFNVSMDEIMLALTTVVSLEAIYLSLFIQMTVNRNTQSLEDVEEDIEDIQEDVQETQDTIEKIEDNVENLGEDVDEISGEIDKIQLEEPAKSILPEETLKNIQQLMVKITHDLSTLEQDLQKIKEKNLLNRNSSLF